MNNSEKENFQNRTSVYKYDIFCLSSLRSIHVNRLVIGPYGFPIYFKEKRNTNNHTLRKKKRYFG